MPSYLITGASRGIGFELVRQLSAIQDNIVIGLVRNKDATEAKIKEELGSLPNVHVVEGDLASYKSLEASVPIVENITGGKLDVLIANAAFLSSFSSLSSLKTIAQTPDKLTRDFETSFQVNTIGNMHLYNLYLPLILQGVDKKVVFITSGHADINLINDLDLPGALSYTASKVAMNAMVAKYNVEYRSQGVVFFGISPGVVDTKTDGWPNPMTEENEAILQTQVTQFVKYSPSFTGPMSPQESVKMVLKVIDETKVEDDERRGQMISHFGTKKWI